MRKLLAIVGIAALLTYGSWRFWYALAIRPAVAGSEQRVTVSVPSGSSTDAIAQQLFDEGIIRSPLAFKVLVQRSGNAGKLQAGTFVLRPSMSARDVMAAMLSGKAEEVPITIPEGFTVADIDALLTEKGIIEEGDVIHCANSCDFSAFDFLPPLEGLAARGGRLEGYLYPDTYFVVPNDFVAKFFLERMLGTFRLKVLDELATDIAASGRGIHDIITMASLVEEETRSDDERAVVAGILWKRIDEGMGLYVDASNRYIVNKPTAPLTAADLAIDSFYNLRKYRGLPPGPIANPSIESIRATLHPQASPYYYYLHGSDGQIRYAVTNDEHNANKAKYLR